MGIAERPPRHLKPQARHLKYPSLHVAAALALMSAPLIGVASALDGADGPLVVDPAISKMTVAELVSARQQAMRQDGAILRGEIDQGPDLAALTILLQNLTNLPEMFPPGSTNAKSNALPVIWKQKDDFLSIFAEATRAATVMKDAANSGDKGLLGDASRALVATCNECHQTYRRTPQ